MLEKIITFTIAHAVTFRIRLYIYSYRSPHFKGLKVFMVFLILKNEASDPWAFYVPHAHISLNTRVYTSMVLTPRNTFRGATHISMIMHEPHEAMNPREHIESWVPGKPLNTFRGKSRPSERSSFIIQHSHWLVDSTGSEFMATCIYVHERVPRSALSSLISGTSQGCQQFHHFPF